MPSGTEARAEAGFEASSRAGKPRGFHEGSLLQNAVDGPEIDEKNARLKFFWSLTS